jgi:hypothetical protein
VCAVSCEPVSKQISLVSGNFTGNFAILGFRYAIEYQKTPALQPLLEQFPTQIISENILKNSEFSNGIRDLLLKNPQIRMRPKTNECVRNGRLLFADLQIGISKPRNERSTGQWIVCFDN